MKTSRDNTASLRVSPSGRRLGMLAALTIAFALVGGTAFASPLPASAPVSVTPEAVTWASSVTDAAVALDLQGPPPPRLHVDPETDVAGDTSGSSGSSAAATVGASSSGALIVSPDASADASDETYTQFASRASRTRGQPAQA